jgi:exonuclease VII small subunit
MAGSYGHVVQKDGNLKTNRSIVQSLENGGDVFETVEEMYGMIWFLAGTYAYRDPRAAVEDARKQYKEGLKKAREANR